jgi:Fe-S cluster assembly ATPase SufC
VSPWRSHGNSDVDEERAEQHAELSVQTPAEVEGFPNRTFSLGLENEQIIARHSENESSLQGQTQGSTSALENESDKFLTQR